MKYPDTLTIRGIVLEFGLEYDTVCRLIASGTLPAKKMGGRWLVLRADIETRLSELDLLRGDL